VLFAVELLDPISQQVVSRGVKVTARGIEGRPIVNASGRFVWLAELGRWPTSITVEPGRLPFAAHVESAPPRPGDLEKARTDERFVRIVLRPTPAYAFDAGVTAVSGRLLEGPEDSSPPVKGARVQLAWHDARTGDWAPPPPSGDPSSANSPREVETDDAGEFAAFLRVPPKPADPDVVNRLLAVRLQFLRPGNPQCRATPDNFPFLSSKPEEAGRVPEGRFLERDLRLGWGQLTPI
jgi:hypothetical protein